MNNKYITATHYGSKENRIRSIVCLLLSIIALAVCIRIYPPAKFLGLFEESSGSDHMDIIWGVIALICTLVPLALSLIYVNDLVKNLTMKAILYDTGFMFYQKGIGAKNLTIEFDNIRYVSSENEEFETAPENGTLILITEKNERYRFEHIQNVSGLSDIMTHKIVEYRKQN